MIIKTIIPIIIIFCANIVCAGEPKFQQSSSPMVRLGIRDKFGALSSYQATFTVIAANGEVFTKTIRVSNDEHGHVIFPDEFNSKNWSPGYRPDWVDPGMCTWSASVGGKKVIGGRFEFTGNSQGVFIRD